MKLEEQLQQVNYAIAAIEIAGQEYQIGSRRLKRADLNSLYQRQKNLQQQIQYEKGQGNQFANTYAPIFDSR